jgi:hypothetical protein
MRFWLALRELLRTWQGVVLSILAILGAIYYGPRKMLETWDWYLDHFVDRKVMDAISVPKPSPPVGAMYLGPPGPKERPYKLQELSLVTGRSDASVFTSLRRLQRRGKVQLTHDGKWIRKEHS